MGMLIQATSVLIPSIPTVDPYFPSPYCVIWSKIMFTGQRNYTNWRWWRAEVNNYGFLNKRQKKWNIAVDGGNGGKTPSVELVEYVKRKFFCNWHNYYNLVFSGCDIKHKGVALTLKSYTLYIVRAKGRHVFDCEADLEKTNLQCVIKFQTFQSSKHCDFLHNKFLSLRKKPGTETRYKRIL